MKIKNAIHAALATALVSSIFAAEGPVPKGISKLDHVFFIMMETTASARFSVTRTRRSSILMGDITVQRIVTSIKSSQAWKKGNNAIVVVWDENDHTVTLKKVLMIVDTNMAVTAFRAPSPILISPCSRRSKRVSACRA